MVETSDKKYLQSEAWKFVLLTGHHSCEILGPYPSGKIEEVSITSKFPFELAKADDFVGR